MNDKCGQARRFRLVKVGAILVMLLIELWLFLPGYTLGAEGNVIPLPPGAVVRLRMGGVMDVKYFPDGNYLAVVISSVIGIHDAHTLKSVRILVGHTGGSIR